MGKYSPFCIVRQWTKNKENWVGRVMVLTRKLSVPWTEESYRSAEIMWGMIVPVT